MRRSAHKKRIFRHDNAQKENSRKFEQKKELCNTIIHMREMHKNANKKGVSLHDIRRNEKP